jgi:hypothetical protein
MLDSEGLAAAVARRREVVRDESEAQPKAVAEFLLRKDSTIETVG